MIYFHILFISILTCAPINPSMARVAQGPDSPQLIESRELTTRTIKLYGERKYDEALPLAKRALELGETALGKTDPRLIALLINLGDLYVATLGFDDAKKSFDRALSIAETNFGREDLRLTRPLDELGYMMSKRGDYNKAADLFSRSLEIKEKLLPAGNIEIARAAFTLGDTYRKSHEYAKAETYYQQALRLYEEPERKADSELVEVLRRYLIVLTAENKKDEASSVQSRLADLSAEAGVVEGGVVNGWAVKLVQPEYPATARGARASGQVAVQVLIDENGKVISANAMSGHPLLQGAAVIAAKASKFTPTLKSGVAVKVRGTIIYNFVLR